MIYLAEYLDTISHFSYKVFNVKNVLQDAESCGQTVEWFGF